MSNWANEAGEPYMTAAELRFEAELDEQSASERQYDDFYDVAEPDWCRKCGEEFDDDGEHECATAEEFFESMEDQWLDGSYEM